MVPRDNMGHGHQHRPQMQQDYGPRHCLWWQLRPGCHHDSCGNTSHPDQCGPGGNMTLRHQHGLRWLTRLWAPAWPSVVTGVMDIGTDPDCDRAMNLTRPLAAAQAQTSPWPQMARRRPTSACSLLPFLRFCLFPQHMNRSASLSYFATIYLLIILTLTCLVPQGTGWG